MLAALQASRLKTDMQEPMDYQLALISAKGSLRRSLQPKDLRHTPGFCLPCHGLVSDHH